MKIVTIAAALALCCASVPALAQKKEQPLTAETAASGVVSAYVTCEIKLKTNELQMQINYSKGKRGAELMDGVDECQPKVKDKMIDMYKELKPQAKTKDQKEALDNWRIEWAAAIEGMDPSETTGKTTNSAIKANEKLKMAFE
jgi:hypothetical protein